MNQPFRSGTPHRAAAERSVTMAGGNKHANAFSLTNEQTAAFLKPKAEEPPNPLHAMRDMLAKGKVSTDIRPADLPTVLRDETGSVSPTGTAPANTEEEGSSAQVATQLRAPTLTAVAPRPLQQVPDVVADEASIEIPQRVVQPNRGGRPLQGTERKVERTVSMHKTLDKLLERLKNHEGVRLDTNVSAAGVAVHLMLYALSHVKDNAVFPGEDGKGLELKYDGEAKGLVADALKELLALENSEDLR